MPVQTTPRRLMDMGLWEDACRMLQMSKWAVVEGRLDENAEMLLTDREAEQLGISEDGEDLTARSALSNVAVA